VATAENRLIFRHGEIEAIVSSIMRASGDNSDHAAIHPPRPAYRLRRRGRRSTTAVTGSAKVSATASPSSGDGTPHFQRQGLSDYPRAGFPRQ